MAVDILEKLALLIEREQEALLAAWRAQVRELPSARNIDVPTLNDHIPDLLKELVVALRTRSEETITEALLRGSPLRVGFLELFLKSGAIRLWFFFCPGRARRDYQA